MWRHLVGVAMVMAASGCATTAGRSPPSEEAGRIMSMLGGEFVDGRTGGLLPTSNVLSRFRDVEVVLVGEHHGTLQHHELQRDIALVLAAMDGPDRIVAAVEWLPASARAALRAWMRGTEPVEALATAVSWGDVWGHDFRAYAPFFEGLRAARVSVEPVNAEPGLARAIARGTELTDAQRALLPPLDSGTPEHRRWFENLMNEMHGGHHGHAPNGQSPEAAARMERLYRAQLVWDETMARGVLGLLSSGAGRVVMCAGMGHTTRGLGIAARLGNRRRLIVHPVETRAEAVSRAKDIDLPEREADLYWVPPAGLIARR